MLTTIVKDALGAFTQALVERAAGKVYGAVRDNAKIADPALFPSNSTSPIRIGFTPTRRAWSSSDSGTQVVGVYVGFVDTDLTARLDRPKVQPATVAVAALEAVEADQPEAIVDEYSRSVKAAPISSVRFTPASRSSSSRLSSSAFQ